MFKLSTVSIKQSFSINESIEIIKKATGTEMTLDDLLHFQREFKLVFHIDLDKLSGIEREMIMRNFRSCWIAGKSGNIFKQESILSITTTSFSLMAKIKKIRENNFLMVARPRIKGIFSIWADQARLGYENGIFFFTELCSPYINYQGVYLSERIDEEKHISEQGESKYFDFFKIKFDLSSISEKQVFITAYSLESFINKMLYPKESMMLVDKSEIDDLKSNNKYQANQIAELQARITELEAEKQNLKKTEPLADNYNPTERGTHLQAIAILAIREAERKPTSLMTNTGKIKNSSIADILAKEAKTLFTNPRDKDAFRRRLAEALKTYETQAE